MNLLFKKNAVLPQEGTFSSAAMQLFRVVRDFDLGKLAATPLFFHYLFVYSSQRFFFFHLRESAGLRLPALTLRRPSGSVLFVDFLVLLLILLLFRFLLFLHLHDFDPLAPPADGQMCPPLPDVV